MGLSDEVTVLPARRTAVGRLRGAAALAAIAVATSAACGVLPTAASDDNKEFDKIQAVYERDPGAFGDAIVHMQSLIDANPDAQRIAWTYGRVCVNVTHDDDACQESSPQEDAMFGALPGNTVGVIHYAKDGDRIFLHFNRPEPPVVFAMYAPSDEDPRTYGKEHGFGTFRDLGDGWSLLGDIDDPIQRSEQFPG